MARRRKNTAGAQVTNFRHKDAKRKNNPPAKIAAEGEVPVTPKAMYRYSPRLDPKLPFDPAVKRDGILELIAKAQTDEPLTDDEAKLLRDALSEHEPWLEWVKKQEEHERGGFAVDPAARQYVKCMFFADRLIQGIAGRCNMPGQEHDNML